MTRRYEWLYRPLSITELNRQRCLHSREDADEELGPMEYLEITCYVFLLSANKYRFEFQLAIIRLLNPDLRLCHTA
jgi:hypothetical protein